MVVALAVDDFEATGLPVAVAGVGGEVRAAVTGATDLLSADRGGTGLPAVAAGWRAAVTGAADLVATVVAAGAEVAADFFVVFFIFLQVHRFNFSQSISPQRVSTGH